MSSRLARHISAVCLTFAGALLTSCGLPSMGSVGASPPAEPVRTVVSPGSFKDELAGSIAAMGDTLWLAKTGLDKHDRLRTRTLAYREGRWRALSGAPRSTTNTRLLLTGYSAPRAARAVPCTAFTAPGGSARVGCFQGGSWRHKRVPNQWSRTYPVGLASSGRKLTLVMQRNRSDGPKASSSIRAFRLKGSRFVPDGPTLRIGTQVLTSLVASNERHRNRLLQVGVTGTSDPSIRQVFTLRSNRWSSGRRLKGLVGGSAPNGPARVGSTTYFAVNQSDWSETFQFSVWSRGSSGAWQQVGGQPLNRGFGQAQGGVFPVGRQAWAIWSEFNVEGQPFGGWFPVETYAARVKPDGSSFTRPVRLWKGRLIFPVAEEVVSFRGRPVFFYMRQFERRGGMKATVDLRSVKDIRTDVAG